MKECPNCGNCHVEESKFCSVKCTKSYSTKYDNKNETKEATCIKCGNISDINKRSSSKSFVCSSCKLITLNCKNCKNDFKTRNKNQIFCSRDCTRKFNTQKTNMSSLGGVASAKVRVKRSKDEIELFNFIDNFLLEKVTHNEPVIDGEVWDGDIIIRDFKVVVMWNGPWHYKELGLSNHSLKQVQNRDRIKKKLFEENGWEVVIFQDNEYSPKEAFEYFKENIINNFGY